MGDRLGILSAVDFFYYLFFFLFFLAIHMVDTIQEWAQEAKWSRGMIPALGAGGPGFKSQFGP